MKGTPTVAIIFLFLFSATSMFAQAPWQLQPFIRIELAAAFQTDQTETTSATKDSTKEIRTGGSVVPPKLIHWVGPIYPREAKSLGIEDTVRFDAVIGKDGKLHDIKLVKGDPVLAKSAMKAVSQWRYRPALLNGKPVEMRSELDVKFRARYGIH